MLKLIEFGNEAIIRHFSSHKNRHKTWESLRKTKNVRKNHSRWNCHFLRYFFTVGPDSRRLNLRHCSLLRFPGFNYDGSDSNLCLFSSNFLPCLSRSNYLVSSHVHVYVLSLHEPGNEKLNNSQETCYKGFQFSHVSLLESPFLEENLCTET